MEFRILGPLEVVNDGRPVSIRRGKEQALLAYLLLHANEVVPSDRLIDALWDERPPPTASKILQNAVSHLRKELGDGRLLTRDPGYVLRVEEGRARHRSASSAWRRKVAWRKRSHSGAERRLSICAKSGSPMKLDAASRNSGSQCSRTGSRATSTAAANAELVPELEELIEGIPYASVPCPTDDRAVPRRTPGRSP